MESESRIDATITHLFDLLSNLNERHEEFENQLKSADQIAQALTDAERQMIGHKLLPIFTNPECEPDPYKRVTFGRILGLLDIDQRKGIGLNADGLPDVDWIEIPEGTFIYQQDEHLELPTFWISRYHITYKQFQAFLDADDGFVDSRWWDGLADRKERYQIQAEKPSQVFRFWNHPFDGACWYDAIAFCRWWSHRLGGSYDLNQAAAWNVRLATEQEWEKAAKGTDGRAYSWGSAFKSGYANFDETDRYNVQQDQARMPIGRVGSYFYSAPSAPGVFPQGASPYGVMDMIGTMWDLTLTAYRHGNNDDLVDYYPRVIRGGTWFTSEMYCNTWRRTMLNPHARTNGDPRKNDYSFRVATSLPPIRRDTSAFT